MSQSPVKFLPYGKHSLDEDDIAAVIEVLKSDWLTTGPTIEKFEKAFAEKVNANEAVVCSSGSAALHLAMLGLQCGPGDAVIVPAQTFLATANACRYVGAEVIFSDVDAETGLMGPENLEATLLHRVKNVTVKAIFVVHLAGQCADLKALSAIADREGVPIIEDACHALGAKVDKTTIGDCHFSKMATFSFHPVKAICMGEGGAVTLNDSAMAQRLRTLRSHGMNRGKTVFQNSGLAFAADGAQNPWYYEMSELGFNFRATDMQCALGLQQLKKLDFFLEKRRALINQYSSSLKSMAPLLKLQNQNNSYSAWHLAVVHIDFNNLGLSRSEVMKKLQKNGVGTQVHYIPVHLQPYYMKRYGKFPLPGAEAYYASCLSLPLHVQMNLEDVDRVARILAKIFGVI